MTNRTPSLAQAQSDGNVTSHHDAESREVLSTNSVDESEKIGGVGERKAPEVPPSEVKLDVPPNGGYGWVCVACCFMINAHTWGLNSSYGVFLAHYLDTKTFRGASSLDFAFVGGLSISQALLVSPIATICTRLYGTRTTLLIGVFFETVSLIGASFAKEIYQLFLSQGIAFGWGMGFLFVGSVGIVPQWFTTRRSLANGIATAGSGFGGLMYSLATNAMIQNISLGWAFRILGTLALVVNFICACLLKDRNKQVGSSQLAFDYCLFKRVEYLLLLGFGFFSMLGYIVLLFSLPNYASSIGLTPRQGSVIGALLNLGQGLGRPPIGYFSDTVGRINMAFAMTFLAGLFSLVIWVFASSYGVLIFYALIGGTVAGTFWTTIAPVTAEVVGLKDVPAALSITWLALVLPTTFSEPIALEITAANDGRYLGAQLFTGFMYIAAAICVWFLRAWKIGELEEIAAAEGRDPKGINVVTALPIAEASNTYAEIEIRYSSKKSLS
ncbi:major facilitator superfamily domain-containing protein [Cryomyces antarcticus]